MQQGGSHLPKNDGGRSARRTNRREQEEARRTQAPRSQESRREEPRRQAVRQQAPRQEDSPRREQPRRQASGPRSTQPQAEPWRSGQSQRDMPPYQPPKRRRKQNVLLILLILLLVGGMLFAGGKLISIMLNYRRDRSAYDSLAEAAITSLAEPYATPGPGETPQPFIQELTEGESEVPIAVDWEYLKSINSDVIGWLYCPGTVINYPVMQAADNDYYLHRGFDRQTNTAGALFADTNSVVGITQSNLIIYGHNMKNGSMLATIEDYVDNRFYEQHPVMYFLTPAQDYRVDLLAAHIEESTLNNYPTYFQTTSDYLSYQNKISSRSFFSSRTAISTDYQLLTLSTCDYSNSYNDPRFLLHGLMVPIQ